MIRSKSQLIFSASAVRRMFGVAAGVAVKIREFAFVVWVHISGSRPTFISKKAFNAHFADWRKAQSKALVAVQHQENPTLFTVRNEAKGITYQLQAKRDRIQCGCDDFKNQIQFIGKGCCKHGYAVLSALGFNTLADYLAAQPSRPRLTNSIAA